MTAASTKKFKALCEALEAERNDLSYLGRTRQPKIRVVTKTLKVIPESFKSLYFHAGRYSSGARDSVATQAWWEFEMAEEL